jgi:rRNA-processing protein FCF1
MDTIQSLLVITTLAILAEVTYLVVKLPRQNLSRRQARPILVDTSVLIDGRIVDVAKSGFIGDTLVIPRTVIGELQFLADNADHEKRARARYGLDVVKELQTLPNIKVEILQDGSKAEEGVDERLLMLAKRHGAAVCTIDFNLNKVGTVEGITILNVNELAQNLRMAYLPGEKILLEIVHKGQDNHQGVGYLADGTMVVVEHANKLVGQSVEIEFIRSIQTAAGKMMFAKLIEKAQSAKVQKPLGKRPVKQQPQEPKEVKERAEPVRKPAQQQPRRTDETAEVERQDRPRTVRPQRSASRSRRPKTSSQREASLIELVENQ